MKKSILKRSCPICDSKIGYEIYNIKFAKDNSEKVLSSSDIVICKNCGFIFNSNSYVQKDYDEHYKYGEIFSANSAGSGGNRQCDIDRYNFQIDKIEHYFNNKNIRILDIGCAKGGLLNQFKYRGYNYLYGLEPEKSCINILKQYDINANVGNIFDISIFNIKFDVIILSHVLEHIYDLKKAIEILKESIAENGILYIEVPNTSAYLNNFFKPFYHFNFEHINHFTTNTLKMLFYEFDCLESNTSFSYMPNYKKYPILYSIFSNNNNKDFIIDKDIDGIYNITEYINKSYEIEKENINRINNINNDYPSFLWGFGYYGRRILMESEMFKNINLIGIIDSNRTFSNYHVNIFNNKIIPMYIYDNSLEFLNSYKDANIFITSPIFEMEIKEYISKYSNLHPYIL